MKFGLGLVNMIDGILGIPEGELDRYLLIDKESLTLTGQYICRIPLKANALLKEFKSLTGVSAKSVTEAMEYIAAHPDSYKLITLVPPLVETPTHHPEDTCPHCNGHNIYWSDPMVQDGKVYIRCVCECGADWYAKGDLIAPPQYNPITLQKIDLSITEYDE